MPIDMPMTLKAEQARLCALGLTLRSSHGDGEYRVNFRGGREATACYTGDLDDAVGTGEAMARESAARIKDGSEPSPDAPT